LRIPNERKKNEEKKTDTPHIAKVTKN
jgi:hypothetical protein